MVGASGRTDPGQKERNGTQPFVFIGFKPSPLEHSHRTVTHEIIELADGSGDNTLNIVPRSSLLQHRFHGFAEKEAVEDSLRLLME